MVKPEKAGDSCQPPPSPRHPWARNPPPSFYFRAFSSLSPSREPTLKAGRVDCYLQHGWVSEASGSATSRSFLNLSIRWANNCSVSLCDREEVGRCHVSSNVCDYYHMWLWSVHIQAYMGVSTCVYNPALYSSLEVA